jgi:hypothetical protein
MNFLSLFSFLIPAYEYSKKIVIKYVKIVSEIYQPKIDPTEIIPKLMNISDEYNYDKYLTLYLE